MAVIWLTAVNWARDNLIDGLTKIDEQLTIGEPKVDVGLVQSTIGASLLPSYLHVFNGHRNKSNSTFQKNIEDALESLEKHQRLFKNNGGALYNYLYKISGLVNEISFEEDIFPAPSLVNLIAWLEIYKHEEKIAVGLHPNYAAIMIVDDLYRYSVR